MQVNVVGKQGKAALVEWQDARGVHRVTLPVQVVGDGNDVSFQDLQAGIPYGIAWEKIVIPQITTDQIAQAFRAKGIWTETDLQKKLPDARAAIQEIYGLTLGFILDAIRRTGG